jgi:hypothetical protein
VLWGGEVPTHQEGMLNRFRAGVMTLRALLDALAHRLTDRGFRSVRHFVPQLFLLLATVFADRMNMMVQTPYHLLYLASDRTSDRAIFAVIVAA